MPGPWASVGVQSNTPVSGFIDAPAGVLPASAYLRPSPSGSVAVAMNVIGICSSTERCPIGASDGARFTSTTVTTNDTSSNSAGAPSSVTRSVTV